MPNVNHRGFSDTTYKKEIVLESILTQNVSIVKRIGEKYHVPICYRFIDACSGIGINPEVKTCRGEVCKGSPLVFLDVAKKLNIDFRAYFIERDLQNYSSLCKTLEDRYPQNIEPKLGRPRKVQPMFVPFLPIAPFGVPYTEIPKEKQNMKSGKYHVYLSDYHDKVFQILNTPVLYNSRRWWQSGMIYFDPNSFPDFDFIRDISNHTKSDHLDLLIHFSATSLKRVNAAFPEKYAILKEYLDPINKEFWFIRELGDTAHHMTFILGTNMKKYEVKAPGWYNIDSRIGQDILFRKSLTKEEYMNLPQAKETLKGWVK